MELCVVGAGYVGLVVAGCLADLGHVVRCVERDPARLRALRDHRLPLFEPGLDDIVSRSTEAGRLTFTDDLAASAGGAAIAFVAVGTPSGPDGEPDLGAVHEVTATLGQHLPKDALVVMKSTVPVGTADAIRASLHEQGHTGIDVVSNPEFLAEGSAVDDFTQPDRIVLGYARAQSGARMERLYAPFVRTGRPVLHMDNRSAEMAKYAANAALAARVSLMNELAHLCESVGADIERVRLVVGSDERIGSRYLFPGAGFGGSCFPKDLLALERLGDREALELALIPAVRAVNARQKRRLFDKLVELVPGGLSGRTIAVWGLAYKAGTDDVRQAPALTLVEALLDAGAEVVAYDPKATEAARARLGDRVRYAASPLDAARGADALAVVTEWQEFRSPDWSQLARTMRGRIVVDGRNLYEPAELVRAGFAYAGIGRPARSPGESA